MLLLEEEPRQRGHGLQRFPGGVEYHASVVCEKEGSIKSQWAFLDGESQLNP